MPSDNWASDSLFRFHCVLNLGWGELGFSLLAHCYPLRLLFVWLVLFFGGAFFFGLVWLMGTAFKNLWSETQNAKPMTQPCERFTWEHPPHLGYSPWGIPMLAPRVTLTLIPHPVPPSSNPQTSCRFLHPLYNGILCFERRQNTHLPK